MAMYFQQHTIASLPIHVERKLTSRTNFRVICLYSFLSFVNVAAAAALNICIAGGTGDFGRTLASKLGNHDVTILSRNKFLASSPRRVTETFGWLGETYLNRFPHVTVRDWDGGDMLDIVGKDWVGWQEDTLSKADVILHMTGGFTKQRVMATERLVRESQHYNPAAVQITVSPKGVEELSILERTTSAATLKFQRVEQCEALVRQNCIHYQCLRFEANRLEQSCEEILSCISDISKKS
jgi:hypothetical protein